MGQDLGTCISRAKEEFQGQAIAFGLKDEFNFVDALVLQQSATNQQHLFKGFHGLTPEKQEENKEKLQSYIKQLHNIDYDFVNELYQNLYVNPPEAEPVKNLSRVNADHSFLEDNQLNEQREFFSKGLLAIAQGKVGVVVLAGGQASRLGADCPKGAFNLGIGGYEEASLFHIFCNKIEALERYAKQALPQTCKDSNDLIMLYIMTSSSTDKATKDYFNQNKYFGLSVDQVKFFQQGDLPALDNDGKIMMRDEFEVFTAPNGNGGFYDAVERVLPNMVDNGVEYLHVVGVDNILNKLADPILIGQATEHENIGFISKYLKKTDPEEKVGIHVENNGKLQIIEYSELSKEQRYAKQGNDLKFNQAFIGQFVIRRQLLSKLVRTKNPAKRKAKFQKIIEQERRKEQSDDQIREKYGKQLFDVAEGEAGKGWEKFHLAKKSIKPYYNVEQGIIEEGNDQINGMKFEQFIFDPFGEITQIQNSLQQNYTYDLQEILREDEFAPIKNNDEAANDNRITAKILQSKLHKRWLEAAGYEFEDNLEIDGKEKIIFVDPRLSYFGEGIANVKGVHPKITSLPFVLPCNLKKKKTSNSLVDEAQFLINSKDKEKSEEEVEQEKQRETQTRQSEELAKAEAKMSN